jgi:hypothetical protein
MSIQEASMKRVLVLAAALATAACVGIGVAASASSPRSGELHVTKECSQYQGQAGQFCTITSSNIPWIRAGMQVVYADAVNFAATPPMLDTDVILSAGHGSAANGHVALNLATAQGTVTFAGGTGAFTTFEGSANVTVDANGLWHWDGTYSFSPPSN